MIIVENEALMATLFAFFIKKTFSSHSCPQWRSCEQPNKEEPAHLQIFTQNLQVFALFFCC